MGALVNQCIPYFEDADELTGYCSTGVTGKKFVAVSGNRQTDGTITVAPPSAGGRTFGVAMYDAGTGKRVSLYCQRGLILPVTTTGSSGAMAAFAEVEVDATGAIRPLASGVAVGRLMDGTAGNGLDAVLQMY